MQKEKELLNNFFCFFPGRWLRLFIQMAMLLLFLFVSEITLAQNSKRIGRWFDEARVHFHRQSYEESIDLCYRILKRDSGFVDVHLLLADIFNETQNTEKELLYLRNASRLTESPLVFYRLGNANYSEGHYASALINYQDYLRNAGCVSPRTEDVDRKIKNCQFALDAIDNPVDFHPVRLPGEVNSVFDEYWPSLTIDGRKLVFTRLIKDSGRMRQEDFYFSEFYSGEWSKAQPIKDLNTSDNEGAHSLSADGKLLFFTACNRSDGAGSCDIYYSIWKYGRWGRPVNTGTPVNTQYWEAQPALSSDGRTLFFTSNRPGGKGGKDIWFSKFKGLDNNGRLQWGEPVNAGNSINTPGDEISPFIHASGKSFYFSSDYHTGMGGYDLFMATMRSDSVFINPRNLGYPVNTFNDEQGLFISADGQTAFFSSSRNSDTGLDIFSFRLDESIRPEPATYVMAKITDGYTGHPVEAQIQLTDLTDENRDPRNEVTDSFGEVLLCLPIGSNYSFSVSKQGYLFYSDVFHLREPRKFYDPYQLAIELMPVQRGAKMNLYNIYFETDSFNILPPSEPELMKLVDFLERNSGLTVEVQGHTDNTGIAERNQRLSNLRAQSVTEFLIEHGIHPSRLKPAGYGAERPVATNKTSEGRRRNRRTTIRILEE